MRKPEEETELTQHENILVTKLDVVDTSSIQDAVEKTHERFGPIDVLVNNAGYWLMWPVEASSMEQIRRQWEVNLFGVINTMQAVIPSMRERKDGVIVNISSIWGSISFPGAAMYMATKWAVDGLSENMYYELAQLGIKMKIVKPGAIKTDFAGRSLDMPESMPEEYNTLMWNLQAAFDRMLGEGASEPSLVADVIYQAATDGTDTLRYLAWADAEQMYAMRQQHGDMAWINQTTENFWLA